MTREAPRASDRATRLALYAAALAAAFAIGPRGPVYWDSFGYVAQAVSGQVGGLGLGRPLFVLASHALVRVFRAAGGSVWGVEPLLRTAWLAVAALSAPAVHSLARRCGLGDRGALYAGLAMALCPSMAHTSAAVLTDAPSVAFALIAFALAARAAEPGGGPEQGGARAGWLAFAAGAALGAAIGLREQAVAHLATFALMLPCAPRGARVRLALAAAVGCALLAAAPVVFVDITQPGYRGTVVAWLAAMRRERAAHPYSAHELARYGFWLVTMGPPVLLAAAIAWVRHARALAAWSTVRAAVTLPALAQLVLLAGYQDISFSPRYLLPAVAGAMLIPAAFAMERWTPREAPHARARTALALAAIVLPGLIAAPAIHAGARPLLGVLERLPVALAQVPRDAVVVTGQLCPAVDMTRRLMRAELGPVRGPAWQTVCPGWSWPADVGARLDQARREGRVVVVDLRDAAWVGPRQHAARAEAEAYLRAHGEAVARGQIVVWR